VGLAHLVRFLVVKLTYPDLNPRFDMRIIFTANYFSVGGDIPVDSKMLLITDFIDLKIKPTQSFRCAHRNRVYMRAFIGVSAHTYIIPCF
jgi:hypothetical protein